MGRRKVLLRRRTEHNRIEVAEEKDGSFILRLDKTANIHSVYVPGQATTDSYWDDFALLPPLIPAGPIGILGLGAGTVVRLYRTFWPQRRLAAWEIDPVVVEVARAYFGLCDEPALTIHIGDAFSAGTAEGPFAGLLVDLFAEGTFHPRLQSAATWRTLAGRLLPGGRLMVNLSGKHDDCLAVYESLRGVFGGELMSKRTTEAWNLLFITGPPPEMVSWVAALPASLGPRTHGWEPVE